LSRPGARRLTRLMSAAISPTAGNTGPIRAAHALAAGTFALYFILLLGANGVARSGGPLAWWPLVRLPTAGGELHAVGIVALLPVVSVIAWALARWGKRGSRPFEWGWPLFCWTVRVGPACLPCSAFCSCWPI